MTERHVCGVPIHATIDARRKVMTLIIAGSPRKGGYSDRIAETYREVSGGEIVYARDLDVKPCIACSYCKRNGDGNCFRTDDMPPVLEKIRKAGTIVIASPIYWWQVTGTVKNVIDRMYALKEGELKGKRLVIIMNGESENDDKEYELLEAQFKEMADYIGMNYTFIGIGTPEGKEEEFQKKLEDLKEKVSG